MSSRNKQLTVAIFSWPPYHDRALTMQSEFLKWCSDVIVVASIDDCPEYNGWYSIGADSYYGAQFSKLMEIANSEIFLLIQADATPENYQDLISRVIRVFELPNVGLYTPHIDYSSWPINKFRLDDIFEISKEINSNNLYLVTQTDSICWAFRKSVLEEFRALNLILPSYGWYIDAIMAALCRSIGLYVVGDPTVNVSHPKSTNYSTKLAFLQSKDLLQQLPRNIAIDIIAQVNLSQEKRSMLQRIQNHYYTLIQTPISQIPKKLLGRLGSALSHNS